MAIKYIPRNNTEIQVYRREQTIKERNRNEITDTTLISMRRVNLFHQKRDDIFKKQILLFNEYIKKQDSKKVLEIINYFLTDIS